MLDNTDEKNMYTFRFYDGTRTVSFNVENNEDISWMEVTEQFLDFLSSIYGYSMKDQVHFTEYSFPSPYNYKKDEDSDEDSTS